MSTLELMLSLAARAAVAINQVYASDFEVEYKGPSDPVTAADRLANQFICEGLRDAFPKAAVVAEESSPESYRAFREAEQIFFVDPLDGTREFVLKNGEFVVMLGLVEDQRATHGVIYAPATERAWLGQLGVGAWEFLNGNMQPIQVSAQAERGASRVVASRSHRSEVHQRQLDLLQVAQIDPLGSAGLKGTEVARGAADAYVAPGFAGYRWDACAVDAIVHAAGGQMSNAYGEPFDYRGESLENRQGVVVSNGHIHQELLERLALGREQLGITAPHHPKPALRRT